MKAKSERRKNQVSKIEAKSKGPVAASRTSTIKRKPQGVSLRKKKSSTITQNTTKKVIQPKAVYADGNEVECVNLYVIVSQLRKTNRQLESDVYIVKEKEQEEELRLKTNHLDQLTLKKEARILKRLSKATDDKHFLTLVEYSSDQTKGLELLVVSPFGMSLEEVSRKVLQGPLSEACTFVVATQMLQAIQELHRIGYIHRNIRPSSFNIGVGDNEACIFLQDFRTLRKFENNKKHVAARTKVKRVGALRFCSTNCHQEKDISRRDDMQSWLFSVFYLLDQSSLVWAKDTDNSRILKDKERFLKSESSSMYNTMSKDFKPCVDMIYALNFESAPEYEVCLKTIADIQTQKNLEQGACDWKGKIEKIELQGDTNRSPGNRLSGDGDGNANTDQSKRSVRVKGDKKKKNTRKKLAAGDIIRGEHKNSWTVVTLLGSGGFGDVYKVHREGESADKCYALKTEGEDGDKRFLRLKVEVTVMMKTSDKSKNFEHFIEFVDRGRCEALKCKFVVMGLVGPSIDDIRKKYILCSFTKSTCFNIAIQTLAAVRDLHSLGYLHRDIKPANYAVGLNEHESTIYMLDFGIAKMFLDADGKHKTPRKKVKFLGTVRFAARACMKQIEQGRKDDLECWLYMVYELMDPRRGIPWRSAVDPKETLELKEGFFKNEYPEVYSKIPKSMQTLVQYINNLEYESEPDYAYIRKFLKTTAKDNNIKPKKLDWIGKLKKKAFESESEKSEKKRESNSGEE